MINMFWGWLWQVELVFRRAACWFTNHRVVYGERRNYEPDYCGKCYLEWPQDRETLTSYLNMAYCWVVKRDWKWFERFDWWLDSHYGRYLPNWWEY